MRCPESQVHRGLSKMIQGHETPEEPNPKRLEKNDAGPKMPGEPSQNLSRNVQKSKVQRYLKDRCPGIAQVMKDCGFEGQNCKNHALEANAGKSSCKRSLAKEANNSELSG